MDIVGYFLQYNSCPPQPRPRIIVAATMEATSLTSAGSQPDHTYPQRICELFLIQPLQQQPQTNQRVSFVFEFVILQSITPC